MKEQLLQTTMMVHKCLSQVKIVNGADVRF